MLEATRRVIGPALPIIATIFTLYIFTGPYLPDAIAFKGASLTRFVSQMTMATEGVYGVPLGVSATVVFLFVLFGSLLDRAGGGSFFIRLAISGLGQFRGGAAKAAVLASAFTGMVSGSSIANVVTAGTFTIPLMQKVGYPAHKAAAIEVAASVNGQLAPPVMGAAAFIIAEYVNVPYVEVAKAAAIPAFAAYAALLWITHIEACKLNLHGVPKSELPSFTQTFKEGFHFLIPVLLLLYELVVLQHSASLSVFRAILLLVAIIIAQPIIRAKVRGTSMLRGLWFGIKELLGALASGGINMLSVAMATATAGIIVGCVSLGLGQQITSFVEVLSCGNIYLLLIITALASLLLGMGLPTTANYIIIASLTAPILVNLASGVTIHGMDIVVPLMAAHLFCFYFGIMADDTPPVGLAAYAGAAIASCSPIITGVQAFMYDIRTAILPLFFFFNHDIILWNIHSVPLGIFIYLMTSIACMAFGSLTQGWFFARNTVLESLLLLFATVVMMYPYLLTGFFLPYEDRFWGYAAGLAALALTWFLQRLRTGATQEGAGAATA
ncbi:MAG: TRAP transporter permease, partial [Desulfovibrio sp.]|nr:TRAP transporter permease [Desulfovibrio sp.]